MCRVIKGHHTVGDLHNDFPVKCILIKKDIVSFQSTENMIYQIVYTILAVKYHFQ